MTGGGAPRETGRKRTLGNEDHICIKKKIIKRELTQEKEKEKKKVTDSITNFML